MAMIGFLVCMVFGALLIMWSFAGAKLCSAFGANNLDWLVCLILFVVGCGICYTTLTHSSITILVR